MVSRFIGSGRLKEGGLLATHKQDHNAHVTGGDERHTADHIDMNPPVDGYEASTVQETLELYGTSLTSVGTELESVSSELSTLVSNEVANTFASVQLQNSYPFVIIDAGLSANYAMFNEEDKYWAVVGDNGDVFYSAVDGTWTEVDIGTGLGVSNDFTYAFEADGYTVVLDNTSDTVFLFDVLASTDGYKAQVSAADKLWSGVFDPIIDKAIVVGANFSSKVALFLTSDPTNLLTTTMDRLTQSKTISLGTALVTMSMHIATNGNGRVLCLAGYREGTFLPTGRTDMFVITKNTGAPSGISISQTLSVGMITGTAGEKAVTGLAYDAVNDQWVAVTLNGEVWTSPANNETWTRILSLSSTFFYGLSIVGSVWVSQGIVEKYYYSIDGGLTWQSWLSSVGGTVFAYSNVFRQFLFVDGNQSGKSLSVGLTTRLAV